MPTIYINNFSATHYGSIYSTDTRIYTASHYSTKDKTKENKCAQRDAKLFKYRNYRGRRPRPSAKNRPLIADFQRRLACPTQKIGRGRFYHLFSSPLLEKKSSMHAYTQVATKRRNAHRQVKINSKIRKYKHNQASAYFYVCAFFFTVVGESNYKTKQL